MDAELVVNGANLTSMFGALSDNAVVLRSHVAKAGCGAKALCRQDPSGQAQSQHSRDSGTVCWTLISSGVGPFFPGS